MTILKRCPFCGGEVVERWFADHEALQCDKCGMIFVLPSNQCGKNYIEAFNTRTPEIVRCGECVYWEPENCRNPHILMLDQQMTYDDFCSWGERREEDAKKK